MATPQPPYYGPPPTPTKSGLSNTAKILIVVAVIIAVLVGSIVAYAFVVGLENTARQASAPNIQITDSHATGLEDCGFLGSQTTSWTFTAILVNTGGRGYAQIGFDINGGQVTTNTYLVLTNTELSISDSVTLSVCQNPASSTFELVLLSQTAA